MAIKKYEGISSRSFGLVRSSENRALIQCIVITNFFSASYGFSAPLLETGLERKNG